MVNQYAAPFSMTGGGTLLKRSRNWNVLLIAGTGTMTVTVSFAVGVPVSGSTMSVSVNTPPETAMSVCEWPPDGTVVVVQWVPSTAVRTYVPLAACAVIPYVKVQDVLLATGPTAPCNKTTVEAVTLVIGALVCTPDEKPPQFAVIFATTPVVLEKCRVVLPWAVVLLVLIVTGFRAAVPALPTAKATEEPA